MPQVLTIDASDTAHFDPETDYASVATKRGTPIGVQPEEETRRHALTYAAETVRASDLSRDSAWFLEESRKLSRLQTLGRDWEVSGALPPNDVAIRTARLVLKELARIDLRPDFIDPSTDEGVCFSFGGNNRNAGIECYNTGEILAFEHERAGDLQIREVTPDAIPDAVADIRRFINR